MPPKGPRLTEDERAKLAAWIEAGAEWPESGPVAANEKFTKSSHWSFQPVTVPAIPKVRQEGWARTGVDRFLQAKREEAGLEVGRDADARTLIRRATYDLTGLPPTPDAVEDFVRAATGPAGQAAAFEKVVDRLLQSARYGERWGRHWMDWVRYADTAGDNSDYPVPQAYLYRNYIIAAFNADLPYDRFVTEQLAGDLLPAANQAEKNRQTIATGYLAMARRFGSLVERYPWHLTIEDTIDNMGRTMLGLTISCARCHDHKFDPISTRDYYGLYGIFASTRYPFPGIELFSSQKDFVPLIPADKVDEVLEPHQQTTERLTAALEDALKKGEDRALEIAARESSMSLGEIRKARGELDGMLFRARKAGETLAKHLKELPPIPTAYAVTDGRPGEARVQIKGEPERPGAVVVRKFPDILGGQVLPEADRAASGRLQLAQWLVDEQNPLTARVIVNRVWQRHFGTGLVPSTSDFGLRGEAPTHPELLDWLAGEFIRSGWSIKQLHRLIMSSRAYQLASEDLPDNLASDPANRLYWKFNRQRLDAESIRDTLLQVSGSLDSSPQAAPYPVPPVKNWKYTQHHPFQDDYPDNKRSVYQMTKRLTAKPYMQTFDGADPNVCTTTRDRSVTALQALYFFNDEFVHEQANRFARALVETHLGDAARLEAAYVILLARPPDEEERTLLTRHLADVRLRLAGANDAEEQAWASVARSLFRLNELLYLD
jgi:hypothetical protein